MSHRKNIMSDRIARLVAKYTRYYLIRKSTVEAWQQEKRDMLVRANLGSELKRKPMDTIGSLVDKLSIVNIKIYMAEDRKREPGATDKQIADATRLTNKLNTARNQLIAEIDEMNGQSNAITIKTHGKTI